ncbi:MAG: glycosyltransferase [Dehalococcoidia bacterium]|nr:glycosyltransferase [Dehalococcoidia bacterium]
MLVYGCAGLGTNLLIGQGYEAATALGLGLAAAFGSQRLLPDFTPEGRLLMVTNGQLALFGLLWAGWFIATIPVSELTRALMFAGYAILILTVPAALVGNFEQWEALCRRTWRRPRTPLPARPRDTYPKVSLHVPAYAEPPEMVIATLDALARLRYPNFEVLVIDNNTKDPALWTPVEEHCLRLGKAFRFFHVDPLSGAKAGAVNFALRRTAPDAELVGVLDSDYQTEPDFLERLIGFFDDPRVGFVQTPHDYREWQDSLYQRMCYCEYAHGVKNTLAVLNERDAAYTIGTMCLIRRRVLEEAGGWAEWCLTEDSELAIRIHALGYSGVYLTTTFGRGLIPETFLDYKKQRFRWTYGPISQVRRHFWLLLPRAFGHPSLLTTAQKVHELSHGLGHLNVFLSLLLASLGALVLASMLLHQEVVAVPPALLWTVVVFLTTGFALRWLIFGSFWAARSGIIGGPS